MNYYALQVKTLAQESFIEKVMKSLDPQDSQTVKFIFPKKEMPIRKAGKTKLEISPMFPGYLFLGIEKGDKPLFEHPFYWLIRTTSGFYRFLPMTQNPKPLEGRDLATLHHFISFGSIAERSRVMFDENDRIKIIDGPLKGLEGLIKKVDKRKKRAKVKLDLYEEAFLIDLAFEIIGQE